MTPPPGYKPKDPQLVCKLRKSIYDLRQASRNWFAKLSSALEDYGFKRCQIEHSLFVYEQGSTFLAALVYVNDIILAGNNADQCEQFKSYLNQCFHIKDLGKLKYFLGIEVVRSPKGLFLNQRKYDILKEARLSEARPSPTPMEQHHQLSEEGS